MPKVDIPKVGTVEFPDTMKPEEVAKAAGELHDRALMSGVMTFLAKDPSLQDMKASEFHKHMGGLATILEKFPRLAQAVDAGMANVPDVQAPAAQPGTAALPGLPAQQQPADGQDQT
jgi:hypothetical protein